MYRKQIFLAVVLPIVAITALTTQIKPAIFNWNEQEMVANCRVERKVTMLVTEDEKGLLMENIADVVVSKSCSQELKKRSAKKEMISTVMSENVVLNFLQKVVSH